MKLNSGINWNLLGRPADFDPNFERGNLGFEYWSEGKYFEVFLNDNNDSLCTNPECFK